MLNDEILKAACVKANDTDLNEFLEKLSLCPDVTLKRKDKKSISEFLKILDGGYKNGNELNLKTVSKKYNSKRTLKTMLIAAIILALLVVTGMAVKPVRNFFTDVTSDGTFFKFGSSKDDDYLYASYNYIPDGYELESDKKNKLAQEIIYNKDNLFLIIKSGVSKNESDFFVNSEFAIETGEIMVGTSVAYYCINKEDTTIVWATGRYNYMIMADNCDDISVETLVKIALSREKSS